MGSWISSTRSRPASLAARVVAAAWGSSNSAGIEITAWVGRTPSCSSTSPHIERRISAESSSGLNDRPEAGNSISLAVPISRLNSRRVFFGSRSRCLRARWPIVIRPCLDTRTTEGVSALPSALRITTVSSPSKAAAAELVVPRSKPTYRVLGSVIGSHPRIAERLPTDDQTVGKPESVGAGRRSRAVGETQRARSEGSGGSVSGGDSALSAA